MTTQVHTELHVAQEGPEWWLCTAQLGNTVTEAWAKTRAKAIATALRRLARSTEMNGG